MAINEPLHAGLALGIGPSGGDGEGCAGHGTGSDHWTTVQPAAVSVERY